MYNIVFEKSVTVSAKGIICSVFLIIMVLVAVTSILACFKRKLSTIVSIIYIFIYFLFVIVSLGFVYKWFVCPVWNKYPRKMLINHLIIKFLFLLHYNNGNIVPISDYPPRGISYKKVPKSVRACASYCGKPADICIHLKKV